MARTSLRKRFMSWLQSKNRRLFIARHKSNVRRTANPMISCMRHQGSAAELEHRRFLAVRRVLEGDSAEEVADFLEIDARSIRRWLQSFWDHGWDGLMAHPVPGGPRALSPPHA